MKKVFLGGTCNNSPWREDLIPLLEIDYFNPVVPDWTIACMAEEIRQREICDYNLYVITPSMPGVYSIAEVVDDSNKHPEKTILCVLYNERKIYDDRTNRMVFPSVRGSFSPGEKRSLESVKRMVETNGASVFDTIEEVVKFLNK